ncbi:MAG TPA: coenzyme F430 synthase [Candidatus Acidoferrum sp.]|nr:coenzyme F430 synthase [Candidatus Acidoferrum sp.]
MDYAGKDVAVLDTIHGGKTICRKLGEMDASASTIDIYREVPPLDFIDQFDIVVAPIHAATPLIDRARFLKIPVMTHHEVVGDILRDSNALRGKLVFEITGVRGKTTVSTLLAELYSDKRLLVLSSAGLEIYDRGNCIVQEKLSITPASMLTAIDIIDERQLNPDVFIFEVSLGGTGVADIGIITSLLPEYRIASNSRSSTEAKLQMVSHAKKGSLIVAGFNEREKELLSVHCNSFGKRGSNVSYDDGESRNEAISTVYDQLMTIDDTFISGKIAFTATEYYDLASYSNSILCFITTALSTNSDPKKIVSILTTFKGIKGRMSLVRVKNRILIDNSNSGLTPALARHAITYGLRFKKSGSKAVLIIGEEAHNVCEGMNPEDVAFISLDSTLDSVILVGERMHSKRSRVMQSASLETALSKALDLTKEGDIIISCVKKWR